MATYFSNQTGLWSSANTWLTGAANSLVPIGAASLPPQSLGGDRIIIRSGHTVTYDVIGCFGDESSTYGAGVATTGQGILNLSANAIVLSGGTLKADRTSNIELTARGSLVIGPSATLDWGTTADPLLSSANITLHCMLQLSALSASAGAAGIYLWGPTADNQTFNNNIYINGKPKLRNTTLAISAATGSTVISATSSTGWAVGDRLVISSEYTGNIASTTVGVLSSTTIVSMTGNNITISPGLNAARSAGTPISNFSSNVNIKSYNPIYSSYGIYCNIGIGNIVDINYIHFDGVGNGVQWTQNGVTTTVGWTNYSFSGVRSATSQTGTPVGCLTLYNNYSQLTPFSVRGITMDNPSGASQHYGLYINGKWAETLTIDDYCAYSPNGNGYGLAFNTQASALLKNSIIHRSNYPFLLNTSVPNKVIIDKCYLDASSNGLGPTLNGLTFNVTNSRIRSSATVSPLDAVQSATIKNSSIYHGTSNGAVIGSNVNASGSLNFSNCNFYYNTGTTNTLLSSFTKTPTSQSNKSAQSAEITVFQANNNLFDYRKFNYYHYSQADLTMRKRGITSYRIKPERADTQFYNYFTLAGVADTPQRIKGSLRFDSNYGTAYPPSINFNGAGVDTTFTCTSSVNTWQDFDVTLTPTSTDDITITITCQSTLTTGYVWFDGVPIYPFVQNVRHYGFIFDKASDRTVNTLNTLTENQVSALSTVSNLDYLYDAANYWSVTNPASSSYIDLCTVNGSVLDFGNQNIIIASTPLSGFTYNSTLSTITINSTTLSGGNNFTTLKTNGLVTLSGSSTLSDITVNANVSSLNVSNLNNVTIPKLLSYNTNSPSSVIYTNCAITSATNTGSANVTIKKINSTVTYV